LLKALRDMSDVEENDLDLTPVRDNDFIGMLPPCLSCDSSLAVDFLKF